MAAVQTLFPLVRSVPKVTLCPPMPAHQVGTWKQCLSKKQLPVSASFHADGEVESTGLSFSDYERCQTQTHKLSGERRLETPEWVLNSASLRKVMISYLLSRSMSHKACLRLGSLSERDKLTAALKAIREREQNFIQRLVLLEDEYVAHSKCDSEWCKNRRKLLRRCISSLDSQIILQRNPDRFFQILYCYFFLRYSSAVTADACQLTPCNVRQILRRMGQTAERLGFAPAAVRQQGHKKKVIDPKMCTRCRKRPHAENRLRCPECLAEIKGWHWRKKQ